MGAVRQRMLQHARERADRAARRADLRARIKKLEEDCSRLEAKQAVDQWQRDTQNSNGHREEAPGDGNETMIDQPTRPSTRAETGGQRRPAGSLRGVPWYDSDEGATWDF